MMSLPFLEESEGELFRFVVWEFDAKLVLINAPKLCPQSSLRMLWTSLSPFLGMLFNSSLQR